MKGQTNGLAPYRCNDFQRFNLDSKSNKFNLEKLTMKTTNIDHAQTIGHVTSDSMLAKIYNLAIVGIDNGCEGWYQTGLADVHAITEVHGGTVADWAFLLSVYSPRVSVSRAARLALMHYQNPDVRPAGSMSAVYRTAAKYRERSFLNGLKTENFRRAILSGGFSDDLVLDVHMANALEIDQSTMYRKWIYQHIENLFRSVQSMLADDGIELTIAQLQAAVWGGQVLATGGKLDVRGLVPADVLKGGE